MEASSEMPNVGRKLGVGLAALAGALLGLEKIGGVSVTPGERTGFAWSVDPSDSSVVRLRSDAGNLSAWIDLTMQASSGPISDWNANLPGQRLHVLPDSVGQNAWRVQISRTDSMAQEQFSWRSGQAILLSAAGARGLRVVEWTVHTDKGRDTKLLARWRTAWFYILLLCTVIGLIWAISTAVKKEKEPTPLSIEEHAIAIVKEVIAGIEGKNAEETHRIRKVLKAVALDRVDPATAVADALPDNATPGQKFGLLRRTSRAFTARMDALGGRLARFGESLNARHGIDG